MTPPENELYLVAINLTRRCNLRCAHCYLDAESLAHGTTSELTDSEVKRLLDDIALCSDPDSRSTMVVLTGGEPLIRTDLETLLEYGASKGLFMVVGTNGTMLTKKRVSGIQLAGAMGIAISLDSMDSAKHDTFRGLEGAWRKTLNGIENCRSQLPFQLHVSLTQDNLDEIPAFCRFALDVGAWAVNFFFLVCTGRGETMTDISAQQYEQAINHIIDLQDIYADLIIRARCAPHYQRLLYQRNPSSPLTRLMGYEGGACIAGTHYCRITPEGGVTACPYLEQEVGNIRQSGFRDIWQSHQFDNFRSLKLEGKCGTCEFSELCGGCRARALASRGNIMAEDPWCDYSPGKVSIVSNPDQGNKMIDWQSAAQKRLQRTPAFLREMVKKRTETYALEIGATEVKVEHLVHLAKRRFGEKGPPK